MLALPMETQDLRQIRGTTTRAYHMSENFRNNEAEHGAEDAHERSGGEPERAEATMRTELQSSVDAKLSALRGVSNGSPEKAAQLPSCQEIMQTILDPNRMVRQQISSDKKAEAWSVYTQCIDDFRKGYANLPPLKDTSGLFVNRITAIMTQPGAKVSEMIKIFDEEREVQERSAKFWEKVKRVPGVNFVAGIFGGGAELAHGFGTLLNEERKALGIGVTTQEQMQSVRVLDNVSNSLLHPMELLKSMGRVDEYDTAFGKEFCFVRSESSTPGKRTKIA